MECVYICVVSSTYQMQYTKTKTIKQTNKTVLNMNKKGLKKHLYCIDLLKKKERNL